MVRNCSICHFKFCVQIQFHQLDLGVNNNNFFWPLALIIPFFLDLGVNNRLPWITEIVIHSSVVHDSYETLSFSSLCDVFLELSVNIRPGLLFTPCMMFCHKQ
jgi:hypothetical protein